MKRKKMKPIVAWVHLFPTGRTSCLFYETDVDMRRAKCQDKCCGSKVYGRYVKVRIVEVT